MAPLLCDAGGASRLGPRRAPPAPSRERKAQKREARALRCGGWGTGEHPFCARELAGAILRLESRVACLLIDRSFQVFSDAIPHRRQRFLKCPFLASYFSTPANARQHAPCFLEARLLHTKRREDQADAMLRCARPHANARLLVTFMRISHKGEASQPRQGGLASGRKKKSFEKI